MGTLPSSFARTRSPIAALLAIGAMALAVGAGLGASVQALARRPIEVLRAEVG